MQVLEETVDSRLRLKEELLTTTQEGLLGEQVSQREVVEQLRKELDALLLKDWYMERVVAGLALMVVVVLANWWRGGEKRNQDEVLTPPISPLEDRTKGKGGKGFGRTPVLKNEGKGKKRKGRAKSRGRQQDS